MQDLTPRVLVTGAGGFVGRHCVDRLAGEVHPVGREKRGAEWHVADLLDPGVVRELVRAVRPTHLLHLAWVTEHGAYWSSRENLDWMRASLDLFTEFRRAGGKRIVATGSCAEYEWSGGRCIEGTTPLEPSTLYGQCKLHLQQQLAAICGQAGISYAWARVFFLYGPHEDPRRLVPSVIGSLLRGERAACTHGRQLRDFMHVEDLAAALAALLDSDVEGPINVASGLPVSLAEIVTTIAERLDAADRLDLGAIPARPDDPDELVADVSRLRQELGFEPGYTLQRGLDATIAWWRERLDEHRD